MQVRPVMKLLMSCAVLSILAGCAENKLTRQNFDMIKEGKSTKMEVEMTLGDNYDAIDAHQWEYEDEERQLSVMIHYDDGGIVQAKEWRDARTGEWEGQAPGIDPNPPGRTVSESKSNATIDK